MSEEVFIGPNGVVGFGMTNGARGQTGSQHSRRTIAPDATEGAPMTMSLTSSSFPDGGDIPQKHGKKVDNVSPQLSWKGAPNEAKSFALALVDTHPVAKGYVHWLVVDLDAAITSLPEDAADGAMPTRSRELKPYGGPFPPSGTHEYEFTLYALDAETVALPANIPLDEFKASIRARTLATARVVGRFTKTPQ